MDNIRIAILSANNTPVAFMDNGHKKSMHYWGDELHEYLQGTANTYTFTVNAKHPDAQHVKAGNKVAFTYKGKSYYLNIVNTDQTEQTITATAWSLSFELINEDAGEYKAGEAMSFEEYLAVFDAERTLKLGLNEVSDKRITNEWTGTTSVLKRLFSLANVFSAEIEFETVLNRDYSLKEIVLNVYRKHSDTDSGVGEYRNDIVLRYGKGITGIRKTTDAEKLYTCIQPTGKDGLTINGLDKKEYDENGNIEYFTDGAIIRAPQARDRFPSNIVNKADAYILMRKEYDTDSKDKLYSMALSDLKTASEPVVTYEVDGYFDTNIGDTVRMQDQEWTPVLYLQARVSEQVRSLTNPKTAKTVFSNYKELTSEISDSLLQRMQDLINKNKVYTCSISTNNGIIFKNGIGSTTLTAYAYDNGVDVADKLQFRWSKDRHEFYVGKSVTVNATDVDTKAVYSFEALENGIKRGYYEVTITDVMDGEDGKDGTNSRSYILEASDTAIKKGADGALTPSKITFRSFYRDGDSATRTPYNGRFKIEESTNGTSYSVKYTSSANESAKEYTPTATAKILRCTLYSADGTINALDTQSVVVLTDVDNLEIGGRNLLLNTRDFGSKSVWIGNRPNPVKDTDGMSYVGVVNTWSKYLKQRIDLLEDIYTLSFYAKASSETTLEVRNDNAPIKIFHTVNVNSVDWKRYLVSVEVDYEHNTDLTFFTRAAETIYIKGIKLEKGNKATDWTPAPEDVDEKIDDIQIGGRNILKNSKNGIVCTGTDYSSTTTPDATITTKATGMGDAYGFIEDFYTTPVTELSKRVGAEFAFSLDVKITGSFTELRANVDFRDTSHNTSIFSNFFGINGLEVGKWTRVSGVASVKEVANVTPTHSLFSFNWSNSTVGSTIEYRNLQLEEGNKSTAWTPAPEDIETLVVTLSNDSQTVATDTNGNGGNFVDCSTKVQVYNGTLDVSKVATYTVTKSSGIAGTWDLSTRTYKVSALSTDNGWVDIKVTYNGNSITRRFTVSKSKQGAQGATGPQGDNGPQGPAGTSGRGIKTITEYYLISSAKTGITTTSSGWSTSVPTMTETNKYLWNYEKFTFTDNTTATTTPKIIGIYGDKGTTGATGPQGPQGNAGATGPQGATGNGIKSITNYYLATASGSGVSASTSGWTTTVQAITASKKYLWNYEVVTYTNGSTYQSAPCIIGAYGDKGATGATGATGPSGIIVSSTAPSNPKVGQLWQTASGQPIKRWDGSRWVIHYISVDNLNAQTLSAIAADLGTVTAGLIKSQDGHFFIQVNTGEIYSEDENGINSSAISKGVFVANGMNSGRHTSLSIFPTQIAQYFDGATISNLVIFKRGGIFVKSSGSYEINISKATNYDSGKIKGPYTSTNSANNIRVELKRRGCMVTCKITMLAQFPGGGEYGPFNEVKIPVGYRPVVDFFAPYSEVVGSNIFGTGRYDIGKDGGIKIYVENAAWTERHAAFTWITDD